MWILTVSVMSEKNNGKETKNIYIISMGRKGEDHNIIEDDLSESIIKFNSNNEKWFSSPRHNYKKWKPVFIFLLVWEIVRNIYCLQNNSW